MEQREKPQVGRAILFGIIALFVFYVCYLVLTLAVSLVFTLLSKIPIINRLVAALFEIRGDSPSILAAFIAFIYSYSATEWVLGRFCDIRATEQLSWIITGVLLLILNALFLFSNISSGQPFILNIIFCICGIVMIVRGRQS